MDELVTWLSTPDPATFPYDAVVAELRRSGKHFAPKELLATLDRARESLPEASDPDTRLLAGFLHTALDKWDERFDNPSYLAIGLLPLPGTGDRGADLRHAAWRRDRLTVLLMADTLGFELAGAEGRTELLPRMRPPARITSKRCRHALRVVRPALARLGLCGDLGATDPVVAAAAVCRVVEDDMTVADRRMLRLTLLPVYELHDEYMFMRVLQSYETTFAFAGVQLAAAVTALADGSAEAAIDAITAAAQAMDEAAPLFSLVATMQPQAFLSFREFTEGASAIQSRSYKRVESLCRRPDPERLDSPAYHSVPEVRERVLAGQLSVDEALTAARESGSLTSDGHHGVRCAMQGFEESLMKWRKTHYRLAVRMLGERRGTGYTDGVPYLDKARAVRVFARPAAAIA
jgi:tryptophan 2,3-dioxygenase